MLGSVADAEDVVQDAFMRWHAMDRSAVKNPPAFLRQVITRLSLDVLKAARRTRELYVGPWLPEPVMTPEATRDPGCYTAADASARTVVPARARSLSIT